MTETKQRTVGNDLTQGNILHKLLTFAIPIVLASLVQQLYSTVDLVVIGQYVGNTGTVAVSTGGEISDLMTPIAMAFSTAAQIYIAQLAGAKKKRKIAEASGTLFTVMGAGSIVMTGILLLFCHDILNLLNCPEEAMKQAAEYVVITTIGIPFVFGYNAICGLLRGMGESRRPFIFVSIAAGVNIVLDIVFVAFFRMESAGTAIATTASQIGAFAASFRFLYKNREAFGFEFSREYFRVRREPLNIMIRLGIPQLVRTIAVNFSMLWVKSCVNTYGLTASATYSVGNKIEKFMNVFVLGIDNAAGAMMGQNLGARKFNRVKKTLYITLCCALTCSFFCVILFLCAPDPLYRLFTTDEETIAFGATFLRIMAVGCIVTSIAGPFKAVVTGAGAAGLSLIIGILDGLCRVVVCLVAVQIFHCGVAGYFWGAALCQAIPGLTCLGYFLSGKWKTKHFLAM